MTKSFVPRRSTAEWLLIAALLLPISLLAQNAPTERSFAQSQTAVESALKAMQATMAGRLPVLDGFANAAEGRSLDRYQRGYYQAAAEVTSAPNGSVVRITAKVTAWYSDPANIHSGYQLLKSNGRLEADLLDQLEDQLAKATAKKEPVTAVAQPPTTYALPKPNAAAKSPEPAISTPEPKFPDTNKTFASSLKNGLASERNAKADGPAASATSSSPLQAEIDSLQEVLKNTAHPKNLVAVKKSGTPVVSKPSLTAKTEFLASQHDEFEMLDFNADWVHVRISGLSRGWIWRNSVEMPEGVVDTATHSAAPLTPAADLFRVSREEVAPFPGDWAPLRGKSVKIISVQKVDESAKDNGTDRQEYTKFLLEKSLPEVIAQSSGVDGVVVIFDSADGGMVAAATATLQDWKAGKLSDAALWHQCFFDPPETFESTGGANGTPASAAR